MNIRRLFLLITTFVLITLSYAFAEVETHGYNIIGGGSYRRDAVGFQIFVDTPVRLINITTVQSGYGSGGFVILYDPQYNDLNHSLVNASAVSAGSLWFFNFSDKNFILYPNRGYYVVQYNNQDWFDYSFASASPLPVDSGVITWNGPAGYNSFFQTWFAAPPTPPFNESGYLIPEIQSIGYEIFLFCGDTLCNNGETCSICPGDCGSCGGGGGASPPALKESPLPDTFYCMSTDCMPVEQIVCSPGEPEVVNVNKVEIITSFKDIEVPYYITEKVNEKTCGIDADGDGNKCDLNEDFLSCSSDCKLKVDEVFCINPIRCLLTEAWFMQVVLLIEGLLSTYFLYRVIL